MRIVDVAGDVIGNCAMRYVQITEPVARYTAAVSARPVLGYQAVRKVYYLIPIRREVETAAGGACHVIADITTRYGVRTGE